MSSVDAPTIALLSTTLVASFLGSLHCAGMCGGLVAFSAGFEQAKRPSLLATQTAYHFGRFLSYTTFGAVAGTIGAALDLTGRFAGVQRVASVVAGLSIAVIGALALARALGARVPKAPVPAAFIELAKRIHMRALSLRPLTRALIIGTATPLLPCGWLYAFVAIAAGSGSALVGALVMAAFWMGTLPALMAVAAGVQGGFGRFRSALPIVCALAMIVVGLHVALMRGALAQRVAAALALHDATIEGAAEDVPACCRGES